MQSIANLRQTLSGVTDWLANLTTSKVLVAVGIMIVALAILRLLSRSREEKTADWLAEHVQVVLSVVVVVFLIIRPFLFQAFYIPSGSMEPTLMGPEDEIKHTMRQGVGDRLLVNKLIYRLGDPKRGDIVVFKAPPQASPDEKEFIKRVVGLPGEAVDVIPPRMLVDGKVAVKINAEGGNGISINNPDDLRIKVQDNRAQLKSGYDGEGVTVMAAPDAQVQFTPEQVVVNGHAELTDALSRITEEGLQGFGADPELQGHVYRVSGEPRLIVINGRKLEYDMGHVLVNNQRLSEPYIAEPPRYDGIGAPYMHVKLQPRQYFMMGDNRNNSNDGRGWGPLSRDRVIGRAEILFWPVDRFRILHWWLLSAIAGLILGYQLLQRAVTRIL